jgi:hypothetical protein
VLDWFLARFQQYLPHSKYPTDQELLFGFHPARKIPVAYSAMLGVIRHQLWLTRNASRFDSTKPDVDFILSRVKSTFRFLLRVQHRNCKPELFAREWLAKGAIGILTPDNVLILRQDFRT